MYRKHMRRSMLILALVSASMFTHAQTTKPKLTLDEFFNSVGFTAAKVSPDGNSVVIATEKADWEQQIFRKELWLYRTANASLAQLTQSGHDTAPQWSPDGQWIAFLSERKVAEGKDADTEEGKGKDAKEKDGKGKDAKEKEVAHLF